MMSVEELRVIGRRALLKAVERFHRRLLAREDDGRDHLLMRAYFGQECDDLFLTRMLAHVRHGWYVDIGAHHPYRFSNTAMLHLRGWHGINGLIAI